MLLPLQLVLAYLTSLVLSRKSRPAVTYSQIRDALHKEYEVGTVTLSIANTVMVFLLLVSISTHINTCTSIHYA